MNKSNKYLGYSFKNDELLKLALSHPSLNHDENNQRLEFLGDAVLGLVIAQMLYEIYPNDQEGDLAKRLAALVRGETLSEIAREIDLGKELKITSSEASAGGRENSGNLEDALEALLGAIYLDGGMDAAKKAILAYWRRRAENTEAPPKDAKTTLQEWAQARGLAVPKYSLIETTGPAHAPEFTIEVTVSGYSSGQAKASSKRAAEQLAAAMLLEKLPNE